MIETSALVVAGLVVHDPADSILIRENPIDSAVDDLSVNQTCHGVLAPRILTLGENPPAAAARERP
jgi:hypothetical protein